MKKKEEEWQGEFQRKLKEFDGIEWSRRNGLDLQRKPERMKWNSQETGTEKERRRNFLEERTLRKV